MSGHLKLTSGHLTHTAYGHLALCPGCNCVIARDFTGCRACLEVAYGTKRNIDTLTWTISGTPFVYENRLGGLPYVPLNGNSPSVNGTYIIPCNETQEWWHCAHVGTRTFGVGTPQYYYYSMMARFRWDIWPNMPNLTIWSGAFTNVTGINPYPTLAQGTAPAINQNQATALVELTNPGVLDDWLYELGGACTVDCNTATVRVKCPSASPILNTPVYAYDVSGPGGGTKHNCVEVADLTISAAVALV